MATLYTKTVELLGKTGEDTLYRDLGTTYLAFITQKLNDGATEIANRVIALQPQTAAEFSRTYPVEDGLGVYSLGEIISVVRENGKEGSLEPCSPISPALRSKATDTDSLEYRSKFNPAYYILSIESVEADDGTSTSPVPKVYILPTPSYTSGSVYQRGYVTMRLPVFDILQSTTVVNFFPVRFQYLIPIYAVIKLIESQVSSKSFEDEDEEVTGVLLKALEAHQTQYDNAFKFLGAEGGGQNEG